MMRHPSRRKALGAAVALLTLLPAACTRVPAETEPPTLAAVPSGAAPNEVIIDQFTFRPASLAVPMGTRVTWVNRDDVPHTATSTARPKAFDSGTLDTDDRFSHVFTKPGTYKYYCAVHPRMVAQVIVK